MGKNVNEYMNRTWEINDQILTDAYMSYIGKYGKEPTYAELQELTGLSVPTISKHLKSLKLDDRTTKIKLKTNKVLKKLSELAEEGDVKAIKLYLQVVEKWTEKSQIEHEIKDNTVQIVFDDELEIKEEIEPTDTPETETGEEL